MNRRRPADLPSTPATHRFAVLASRDLENIVDTIADFTRGSLKMPISSFTKR
jgi:hypothetical protein